MTTRLLTVEVCATAAPPVELSPDEARRWNLAEAERLVATAAAHGAEILFHPTVYSMYGESGWEAVLRARAIDNCVYVCTANHGIREDEPWMPGMCLGRSGVVGPDGLTLAETGRYAGVATATLDLARRRLVRAFGVSGEADFRHELWRHRRPETYREIATSGVYGGGSTIADSQGREVRR